MKRKPKFRVGQRVRSIYNPERVFRIDKSILPERIFHEQGTDRWWTKRELLALGDSKTGFMELAPSKKGGRMGTHPHAFQGISGKELGQSGTIENLKARNCLECGESFKPGKRWQKFCSDYCRRINWKRMHSPSRSGSATEMLLANDEIAVPHCALA